MKRPVGRYCTLSTAAYLLLPALVLSQTSPSPDLGPSVHQITIRGDEQPNLIPFGMKFSMFLRQYEGSYSKVLELSDSDHQTMLAIVKEEQADRRSQSAQGQKDFHRIVADLDSRDMVTVGREFDELESQAIARQTKRAYRHLDRLSSEGRASVVEFIDSTITPSMSIASLSMEKIFADDPDRYRSELEAEAAGRNPAVADSINDELQQQPPSLNGLGEDVHKIHEKVTGDGQ